MTYPKHEQAALEDCRERLAKAYETLDRQGAAIVCRTGAYDDDEAIPSMMQLRRDFSAAIKAGGDALEAFVISEPMTVDERITELAKELLVKRHPESRKTIMTNGWPRGVSNYEANIRAGMELAEWAEGGRVMANPSEEARRVAGQADAMGCLESIHAAAAIIQQYGDQRADKARITAEQSAASTITALRAEAERAWRERNIACAKVKTWEDVVFVEGLPLRAVKVDEWGPGEGETVTVPVVTPRKLTDLLDELQAARAALESRSDG